MKLHDGGGGVALIYLATEKDVIVAVCRCFLFGVSFIYFVTIGRLFILLEMYVYTRSNKLY